MKYLTYNKLLSSSQHGFIYRRSTLTQQLNLLNNLTLNFDEKVHTDIIYLDLSKAFDRVSHQKLIHVLQFFKIDSKIILWLRDYLSDRKQKTIVDSSYSKYQSITSGVPQGSVLGPLLFLLYVEDLLRTIISKCPNLQLFSFADDIKIIGTNQSELQKALDIVNTWTQIWQLEVNPVKSEHFIVSRNSHTQHTLTNNTYNFNNIVINKTDIVRDLGILLTSDLSWLSNIQKIKLKATRLSHIIIKLFKTKHLKTYITAYKTYIRPILEYNVSVWSPHKIGEIKLAEQVQKTYTRIICKKLNIKYNDYKHRLNLLNIESLEYRRVKFDLIQVYKIINNIIDIDCSKFFTFSNYNSIYELRRHRFNLKKPPIAKTSIRNYFFSHRVINTWNKLPNYIVSAKSLDNFKHSLNRYDLCEVYKFVF